MSDGRVFFFNRYVYPDHSATSQLLTDLAGHLADAGSRVLLVGSRQRYDDASAVLPREEQVAGFSIIRVGGTRFGRASLPGRMLDYLSYALGAGRVLLRDVRARDTVVMMTDPPMLGALLGPLARWRRARCVHWLQDLFPEVAEGLLGPLWRGWRTAPLRWLRDRSLRHAEQIVAISAGMASRLAARGIEAQRVLVIGNWTDDLAIRPVAAASNTLRAAWGLEGKFVVGYSGNLGRAHDWRTMLDVALQLSDRDDIHFVLIGGGHGLQEFAAQAQRAGMRNVSIHPYQSRADLALSLSVPDLHWLSLLPTLEGAILPSKVYGIQAAARPMLFIGDTGGELAAMLVEHGAGVAVAPGDVEKATQLILSLALEPERAAAMGLRGRRYLESEGSRALALDRWLQALRSHA